MDHNAIDTARVLLDAIESIRDAEALTEDGIVGDLCGNALDELYAAMRTLIAPCVTHNVESNNTLIP